MTVVDAAVTILIWIPSIIMSTYTVTTIARNGNAVLGMGDKNIIKFLALHHVFYLANVTDQFWFTTTHSSSLYR